MPVLSLPLGFADNPFFPLGQAAHEQIIKNLQRENAMISTAWYDLTSRLQSNHVVLQRKDQPKSWLNKQRQLVNGESPLPPALPLPRPFGTVALTARSHRTTATPRR